MKLNIKHTFDAPLDVVLRAKDERFEHTDKIEGLKKLDYKDVKEDDSGITSKRDFEIKMGKVPGPIKKMIPSRFFNLEEISRWDKTANKNEWEMISKERKKLTWKGVTSYVAKGEKTERTVDCTIKAKIPLIGDAIEKQIASGFKKSMEKDARTLNDMIALIQEGKV
ncbi:DUF2505 family protein [bacterium]